MLHQALVKASAFFFFCVFSRRTGTLESSNTIQIQECFVMAKKLKINFKQTQTIREAFADFLLQKKALGLADKTIETYSHHFDIISKYPLAKRRKTEVDGMRRRQ